MQQSLSEAEQGDQSGQAAQDHRSPSTPIRIALPSFRRASAHAGKPDEGEEKNSTVRGNVDFLQPHALSAGDIVYDPKDDWENGVKQQHGGHQGESGQIHLPPHSQGMQDQEAKFQNGSVARTGKHQMGKLLPRSPLQLTHASPAHPQKLPARGHAAAAGFQERRGAILQREGRAAGVGVGRQVQNGVR